MRGLKFSLILTVAAMRGELQANLISYEFSGTITGLRSGGISDFGINVRDAFRLTIAFDYDAKDLEPTTGLGRYVMPSLFTFSTCTKQFSSTDYPMTTWIQHSPALKGPDSLTVSYLGFVTVPWRDVLDGRVWSSLDIVLENNSGTVLASDALPNAINITDWTDSHWLRLSGGTGSQYYEIDANIDSIKPIPDSSNSTLLLSLALVPLMALHSLTGFTRSDSDRKSTRLNSSHRC